MEVTKDIQKKSPICINQGRIETVDKLNHVVAWLDALLDLLETQKRGVIVQFSESGFDGFTFMLMHMRDEIIRASESIYQDMMAPCPLARR